MCFELQNEIIEYDAHRITPEMRSAVNRLLAQKRASFEQANIYRVSQAAAPLAAWVTANLQYADVLQKVAPLEQELGGLTANFTESQVRQPTAHPITTTLHRVHMVQCFCSRAECLPFSHFPAASSVNVLLLLELHLQVA